MKVIAVFGHSKTGKTTTVELIIKELIKRGFKVGSIKDIHFEDFALDEEGTDSSRLKQAGAEPVTAKGLKETDIMFKESLTLRQIAEHYDVDWLVCEGFSTEIVPKLLSLKNEKDLENKDRFTIGLTGKISNSKQELGGLPVFNALQNITGLVDFLIERIPPLLPGYDHEKCGECGLDCATVLDKILNHGADWDLCKVRQQGVTVKIGTKNLPLKPFVKDILSRSFVGALSSLTGFENGKKIVIEIEGLYQNFKKEDY